MTNYNLPENVFDAQSIKSEGQGYTDQEVFNEWKTKFSSPSLHLYLSHNILSVALWITNCP